MNKLIELLKAKREEIQEELKGYPPDYGTMGYGKMEANEAFLEWLEDIIFVKYPEGEFE